MPKQGLLYRIFMGALVFAGACILFIPIISRGFLTQYARSTAEHVLQMKLSLSSAELQILNGSVTINDLAVYHPKHPDKTLMEVEEIDVGLKIMPLFLGRPPALLIRIKKPQMTYKTNKRGNWELSGQVPLFKRGKGERRLPLDVEHIIISDGKVEFQDGKVGKTTRLSDIEVDVKRVRLPSEGDPLPAKFDLSFIIDKAAKYKMKGRADFLSPKISFDADIKLSGLPLPPFAPYYNKRSMPVRITSGSMAMTSHAKCKNDYLKAPAHMVLSGLRVEPKKASILGFASNRVVDTLKDNKGRMELDAMISGNIRSPNFHISSSLSRAFAGGFAKTLVKDVPSNIEEVGKGIGSKIKGLFGR